jgi:hypothetical protein
MSSQRTGMSNMGKQDDHSGSPQLLAVRFCLILSIMLSMAIVFLPVSVGARLLALAIALPAAVLANKTVIAKCFIADEELNLYRSSKARLQEELETVRKHIRELNSSFVEFESERNSETAKLASELQSLEVRKTRLLSGKDAGRLLKESLNKQKQGRAASRFHALADAEAKDIQEVSSTLGTRAAEIQLEIVQADQQEQSELADALKEAQHSFVRELLNRYQIQQHAIIGIDQETTQVLTRVGILSAAEITDSSLACANLSLMKTRALRAWAEFLQQQADLAKPSYLTGDVRKPIKRRYEVIRRKLDANHRAINLRIRNEQAEIAELYRIANQRLNDLELARNTSNIPATDGQSELDIQIVDTEKRISVLDRHLQEMKKSLAQRSASMEKRLAALTKREDAAKAKLDDFPEPSVSEYFRMALGVSPKSLVDENRRIS